MKKVYIMIPLVGITYLAQAQNLVSTFPQGRNAVLEELTGVNCPNCPDGHDRANALKNAYPERVVLINVHAGSFANGTPNLKSAWGDDIDQFINPTGYPAGAMNRVVWPGAYNEAPYFPQNPPNNLAIRRSGWWNTAYPGQTTGEYIILNGGNSKVNIGASSTYNNANQTINISVELYYTETDSQNNELNVAILQNNVIGYQSGGSSNYVHNHILRDLVTGQWGELITTTSAGTLVQRNYTYTLPANYNGIASDINNMEIAIFVTQADHKNIHTGISIEANGGLSTEIRKQELKQDLFRLYPNPMNNLGFIEFYVESKSPAHLEIKNILGQVLYSKQIASFDAGMKTLELDASLFNGSEKMVFVSLELNGKTHVQKLLLNN